MIKDRGVNGMNVIMVSKWNEYLNHFSDIKKDIYFYEEYVKLYEDEKKAAKCVICEEEDKILMMPILVASIEDYYDFETPYGYGGPIANTEDIDWIGKALEAMNSYLREEHFVCGFVRFHSLLHNADYCKEHMEVLNDRQTVAIDTSETEEAIWNNQIISKNRNMIRKAEKNGLEYEADYEFNCLGEFVELYNATMKRLNADEFYFFDKKYYSQFMNNLKGKAFLGTVKKDGELICGAMFMYSKEYGHYHLEGSNHDYSSFGANNYLLWKTAVEFHNLGVSEFHLGGGYNSSPENSLLKFKKSFSHNLRDFYIGKMVFNREKYAELKEQWIKNNPDKRDEYGKLLLCYRY